MRESKRRQIVEAATECFATRGYHAVSISEIAESAGISKGLLYNYFSSKEELLRQIFLDTTKIMTDLLDPGHSGKMTKEDLLTYLDRLFTHFESNLITWKMYMAIFCQPAVQEILMPEIQVVSEPSLKMIEKYFRKEGYKSPKLEMAFMSTLISGVIAEYISDPENYPLKKMKKRIMDIYR